MGDQNSKLTTSDAELIETARSGDARAFGELWRRHYRSAARVARQFTSSIDADDLVSEAYARIYQRVLAGGGPTGAFRPYLYTTIRNLASSWGAASRDVQVDIIEDFEDDRIPDDPAAWALDRTLTARAFRSLPERWQTVLWYTEVEGMDPHEVAPLMGMTANGVAALSYRAREG
jgi:RNA polymerase sigma factor (sigma-70 family)